MIIVQNRSETSLREEAKNMVEIQGNSRLGKIFRGFYADSSLQRRFWIADCQKRLIFGNRRAWPGVHKNRLGGQVTLIAKQYSD